MVHWMCNVSQLLIVHIMPNNVFHSGDFYGGGAIAVECSPLLVAEVETKGRLGRVDGRFPHWVTPYSGNRYSLIYVSCALFHSCSTGLIILV